MSNKKWVKVRRELHAHAENHGLELVCYSRLNEGTLAIAKSAICQLADALYSKGHSIGTTIEPFTGVSVTATIKR